MNFDNQHAPLDSIETLAKWLGDLLDCKPNLILGLFPDSAPKSGIAYEEGEGDKFISAMLDITDSEEIWYLTIDIFHHRSPDNVAAEVARNLLKQVGVPRVEIESSLVRLLPFRVPPESIESLTPPLHMIQHANQIELQSFEILDKLYKHFLLITEE